MAYFHAMSQGVELIFSGLCRIDKKFTYGAKFQRPLPVGAPTSYPGVALLTPAF